MQSSSYHIRNEPCPECRKRGEDRHGDNLGVFSDGHTYCWSCGYNSGRTRSSTLPNKEQPKVNLSLPDDCEPYIPAIAEDWLKRYELTQDELLSNRVLYSEQRSLLVFPYFGADTYTLLGWQGRYFGDNPKHPKWFTKGYIKDFIHLINPTESKTIVYVEDIISAIKVGRHAAAVPIFGSFIPDTHSIRLYRMGYRNFRIWLDPDKYKEAHKFCAKITSLGFQCRVIRSDKDPKDYNDLELKEYLN